MSVWDFVNAINVGKQPLLDNPDDWDAERQYLPFVVNRALSYFPDTLMAVQLMNMSSRLPVKMQFDFLRLVVPRKKRFSKWHKKVDHDSLELVKEYFGYSDQKALVAMKLLSKEDLDIIRQKLFRGGVPEKKRK